MSQRTYNRACEITLLAFLSTGLGADRAIHLSLCHRGPDAPHHKTPADKGDPTHHSDGCNICLQLTVGSTAVVSPALGKIDRLGAIVLETLPLADEQPACSTHHDDRAPRAPPTFPSHRA
jgi:hypothetical protein